MCDGDRLNICIMGQSWAYVTASSVVLSNKLEGSPQLLALLLHMTAADYVLILRSLGRSVYETIHNRAYRVGLRRMTL